MKKIKTMVLAVAAITGLMGTSASAASSCWSTWDPVGCWLQCTFNGPCPVSASAGAFETDIELPSPKTEEYQSVAKKLIANVKLDKDTLMKSREWVKGPMKQTCKPEELLQVINKTQSPREIAGQCFK
ncbi:MAG: hypothetical protein OCD03_09785 [Hyphomicrobiales bacterium]